MFNANHQESQRAFAPISPLTACEDAVLIRMAVEGRSDCFSVLMDRHLVAVRNRLRLMVSNNADLEDLVQELQLKVWRHLPTFRSESSLRTWMTTVAMNLARAVYRRPVHKIHFQPLEVSRAVASTAESADQRLMHGQTLERLRSAVARLPRKYRDVVIFRDLREIGIEETAELFQTSTAAIKTRLFRARRMLSRQMKRSARLKTIRVHQKRTLEAQSAPSKAA